MKKFPVTLALILIAFALVILFFGFFNTKNDAPLQESDKNPVLENIFSRKSVRVYSNKKVSEEDLKMLVKAGMAAPSAVNKQPWAFVIITNRAVMDSLAANLPFAKMLSNANAAIAVCGNTDKALIDVDKSYWVQDCSAASENILLAAESMGLGAVWTGVFPRQERIDVVKKYLELPYNLIPLNIIPIGYPLNKESAKDKFKEENIIYKK